MNQKPVDDPLARLLQGYPGLRGVLEGLEGELLQAELSRLLRELCPPRSARKSVTVIAKLLRTISGCEVEESVIVHDISETGMRVTLPGHVDLSLAEAMGPTFVLRLKDVGRAGGEVRELRVAARCVRLLAAKDSGVELAYTFNDAQAAGTDIYNISQWVKPRAQPSLRPEAPGAGAKR